MECRNYEEHITAAVDNALKPEEHARLAAHLESCPRCRSEFNFEKLTRQFVKTQCKPTRTPGHILKRISEHIESETSARNVPSFWQRMYASLYFRPALAFGAACLAIVILFNTDQSPNVPRTIEASLLPANDVIKQSLTNYRAVVRGDIKPQMKSDKEELVRQFFAGKTDFPVLFPRMKECTLVGGVVNDFSGKTLAHVVYAHNASEVVYIYEACWQTVQSGTPLQLASEVQDELATSGRYVLSLPDGYTIVMWRQDSTLCSAVAMLDRETLLSCLNLTP